MNSIIQKYKEYLASLNVSKVTEKSYISDVKQFLEAKNIKEIRDIRRLRDEDIDIYIQSLSILKKPLTVKRRKSTLRHFLTFLKLTNLIDRPLTQKMPSSFVSLPLSHVLTISYLVIFTIINVLLLSARPSSTMPSLDEPQISTLPDNIKLKEARVVSLENNDSQSVFTISADDSINPFGQAVIKKGQQNVTIYNKAVAPTTLVFVTPVTELKNQNIFVRQVTTASFTIGLTSEATSDVYFNWLVRTPTVTIY